MSKIGRRMIKAANEALDHVEGKTVPGLVEHRPVDVRALRKRLNLGQAAFAERFGLSVGTLRDWEQGRSAPDRPAQTLLRVIEAEPETVQRVLKSA